MPVASVVQIVAAAAALSPWQPRDYFLIGWKEQSPILAQRQGHLHCLRIQHCETDVWQLMKHLRFFFPCTTHKSTASTLKRDHLVSNLQVCLYSRRYQGRGLCNKNLQSLLNLQQSLIGSGVQHGWQHLWTLHLHSPSRMKILIRDRYLSGHCVKYIMDDLDPVFT